jgi:uncharacterized protein with PIN domain
VRRKGKAEATDNSPGNPGCPDSLPLPRRWLCDPTVLRLGRELRALGFPVEACPSSRIPRVREAVLLTRSRRVLADRDLHALPPTLFLRSGEVASQLISIECLFGITRVARPWALCVRCGGSLNRHPPHRFREEAPAHVVATTKWIAQCSKCGHLFWRATHTARQEAFWGRVFGFIPPEPRDHS